MMDSLIDNIISINNDPCKIKGLDCLCGKILNSINEGVLILDKEMVVTFINRAAEKITGFTSQEAIGKQCFEIFRTDICQTGCPQIRALETGEPITDYRGKFINKRGEEVVVNSSIAPILNNDGTITATVEIFRDMSEVEALRTVIMKKYQLGDIISKNPLMEEIFEILPDVAESDSAVLLQGASGTGKGLLATTIHHLSNRKDKPFIKINCGAIPDSLLESEIFGYVKGAFTDAKKDKPGRFSLADRGTLLLDEIGDTSPSFQVKLLRVLEEKEFFPLGSSKLIRVDVRIIAASNKNIEKLVKSGEFREDLYYRLNILKIFLPPLKDRKEDIPLLVEKFIARFNTLKGKRIISVSNESLGYLMNYDFPGNIRELENIIEHAYVLCKGTVIEAKNLPTDFLEKINNIRSHQPSISPIQTSESRTIQRSLRKHRGSRKMVAEELGMSRSTLWRKIKKYHLA